MVRTSLYPFTAATKASPIRVAAGGFDQDGLARVYFAGALSLGNHADADAIFYAGQGVMALQLGDNVGNAIVRHLIKPHHRGAAD